MSLQPGLQWQYRCDWKDLLLLLLQNKKSLTEKLMNVALVTPHASTVEQWLIGWYECWAELLIHHMISLSRCPSQGSPSATVVPWGARGFTGERSCGAAWSPLTESNVLYLLEVRWREAIVQPCTGIQRKVPVSHTRVMTLCAAQYQRYIIFMLLWKSTHMDGKLPWGPFH